MKNTLVFLIALGALAASLMQHTANSVSAAAPGLAESQQPEDKGSAAHIARIENDLPPAVVIKGRAVRAMTLSERMALCRIARAPN